MGATTDRAAGVEVLQGDLAETRSIIQSRVPCFDTLRRGPIAIALIG